MIVSRKRNLSQNESSSLDSSSCSSLNSTTSDSASPQPSRASFGLVAKSTSTTGQYAPPGVASSGSCLKIVPLLMDRQQQLNLELKMLVENEFLFCLNSLDAFNKTKCLTKRLDSRKMCNFIIKNDHLYRIVKYLIQLFETVQPNASSQPMLSSSHTQHSRSFDRITSWTVYLCLLNMKFDVNDKIKYINQMNALSGKNYSDFI